MQCRNCGFFERKNVWKCTNCQHEMKGGIVFVTGISGSGTEEYLKAVVDAAHKHGHDVELHDIGEIMYGYAKDDDPNVRWERILDADEKARRHLRALAFQKLAHDINSKPDVLHIVDLHLCFRWRAYLTKGFEPHLLEQFRPFVRCFINVIADLSKVHDRLRSLSWGERNILGLLIWRDEELFLTDLFAEVSGRVMSLTIATTEPPAMLEKLIWHPDIKTVYLSFPITNLKDENAKKEIEQFRDEIREFLVVFDPYASKDFDETYKRPEMKALKREVGDITEERDYRFIDQAEAVVVYFPVKVPSTGVDAEMNHARRTGKPIFMYSPEDRGPLPFVVPASHFRAKREEYVDLLKEWAKDP